MSDIKWEQLCRNGQLIWHKSDKHRVMLERFYNYFKGTSDEDMIASNYPEFYALMKAKELPVIEVSPEVGAKIEEELATDAFDGPVISGTVVSEVTLEAPKKRKSKKSSPKANVID